MIQQSFNKKLVGQVERRTCWVFYSNWNQWF